MQTAISLLGWFGAFICLVIYLQVKRAEIKRGYFSTLLPVLGPALLALDGGYKGAWFLVFLYGFFSLLAAREFFRFLLEKQHSLDV